MRLPYGAWSRKRYVLSGPLHQQKAFHAGNCKNPGASLPIAEMTASQSVCLPIFPEMTDEQAGFVVDTVNKFYEGK